MKILTLNCGSSSIKFQLINVKNRDVLASGVVERIGENTALFTYKSELYTKKKREMVIEDHTKGIQLILDNLMNSEHGVIKNEDEIFGVGHRLVHGGEFYSNSVVIDSKVMNVLNQCIELAPLHNPANIKGVEAISEALPNVKQCGVFDTAFHQTIPSKAYLYALPLSYYKENKIRRYGFHGTSHKFVALETAKYLNKNVEDLKMITCHIGNGASITAIDKGKSVDTSMGFTPLEGLMMGTRSGDIDPAIPIYMMKNMKMSVDEVNTVLNKKSGILGLSHISNDMREIEEEILANNNEQAIKAFEVYCYKIKKYIGSYAAVMNGVDVIVFTGGVGENMPLLREWVLKDMDFLGAKINEKENNQFKGGILDLSANDSKVKILKVPTNEELMIALETEELLTR
jgi:acetate kinase